MANVTIARWSATAGACVLVPESPGVEADCCVGGTVQRADLQMSSGFMVVWLLILAWIFLGVALGADVFMSAIDRITSVERTKQVVTSSGKVKYFHVRVWNETVANLTLMALGSSAPEILLNIMEVLIGNFEAGELGPSTIVGSAAFNLMVITGVCVACLPDGESRTIRALSVFLTTSFVRPPEALSLSLSRIAALPRIASLPLSLSLSLSLSLARAHSQLSRLAPPPRVLGSSRCSRTCGCC